MTFSPFFEKPLVTLYHDAKTGEKEKMEISCIFFFSNNVFYPIRKTLHNQNCCLQILSVWTKLKFCHLVMARNLALCCINSWPNDNLLDWSNLKAFAENKINMAQKLKFVSGQIGNIVGKGENTGFQQFLLVPQCLLKAFFQGPWNLGLCGKGLTHYHTMPHFDALKIYSCGKHCEKRRNCL